MKRRRDIAIELTPLLDVILILLFLIMSGSSKANEDVKAQADKEVSVMEEQVREYEDKFRELDETSKKLLEENNELAAKVSGYEAFSEYARIITISYTLSDDGSRSVVIDNEGDLKLISFNWDSIRYGESTVKSTLDELIETDGPVFIAFVYNNNRIYKSDYEMLSSLIIGYQSDRIYTKIQQME